MSMNDPVADFLTRIRNAKMRGHPSVESPNSGLRVEIAKVLQKEGFIRDWYTFKSDKGFEQILVNLKYDADGDCVVRGLKRISRPGLRLHVGYRELAPVLAGQGIAIVSTSKGVLTDAECRAQKVGGEVLCHVW